MVLRQPRGYARNIPSYREICEGVRPTFQDTPLEAYTGLPLVRTDEVHHDPIVIDPGTLVGVSTGYLSAGVGKVFPCTMATGTALTPTGLVVVGSTESNTNWGLPNSTTLYLNCGIVKPLGVVYQPIYSFILQSAYTNYKRNVNVGVLTDYVISVPAVNDEEVLIEAGDLVMVGTGASYGAGVSSTYSTNKLAGRYARYSSSAYLAAERIVGKCYRKLLLGSASAATTGDTLESAITAGTFTISTAATAEFANLAKVQTVPGLGLSGSGTSGIPAYLLTARCDASKNFYALTMLIRI